MYYTCNGIQIDVIPMSIMEGKGGNPGNYLAITIGREKDNTAQKIIVDSKALQDMMSDLSVFNSLSTFNY